MISELPAFIEFEREYIFEHDKKYKIIIDFEKNSILVKVYNKNTYRVKLKMYEFDKSSLNRKTAHLITFENVSEYLNTKDNLLTDLGYRDGWYVRYKICYTDKQVFTGRLVEIYLESPFEEILKWLRLEFPHIKEITLF